MKKEKVKYILGGAALAAAFLFCSCSKRADIYSEMNTPPCLTLAGDECPDGAVFRDTLKLGLSWYKNYSIADETGAYFFPEADSDMVDISVDERAISVTPLQEGDCSLSFTAKDGFGAESSFSVELNVFKNRLPIALAEAVQDKDGYDNYEFYIDASESFDPDGRIVAYQYKIENNYEKTVTDPVLRYIPETGGQKKISLKVQDSDGEWSEPIDLYITLN